MDNSQLTAAVEALWVVKPTGRDRKLAARCVKRLLGADCGDILAALGLT